MIENNIPLVCIFEDDTRLKAGKTVDDVHSILNEIENKEKEKRKSTDIYLMRYEAMHQKENEKEKEKEKSSLKEKFFNVKGLYNSNGSYVVTLQGARKIKSLLFPISLHYDMFLGTCANLGKLNIKCLKEEYIFLEDNPDVCKSSTIGHLRGNHWMDIFSFNLFTSKQNHPSEFVWNENEHTYKKKCAVMKRNKLIVFFLFLFLIVFFILFIVFCVLYSLSLKKK